MNILDSLKGLLTDELVTKSADTLNEDTNSISKVMQGSLPAILGGLLNAHSESQVTLSGLFDKAAQDDDTDEGISEALIAGIFGDKANGMINILTNLGGLKNEGSAQSILGIVSSLVASFFGKKMQENGLGFGSMLNMIGEEKEAIIANAPKGVISTLGLQEGPWEGVKDAVGKTTAAVTGAAGAVADRIEKTVVDAEDAVEKVVDTTTTAVHNAASNTTANSKKLMKWLWPLLLLAAFIAGMIWFMKGCNKDINENTDRVAETSVIDDEMKDSSASTSATPEASQEEIDAMGGVLDDAGNWIATKGEAISIKLDNGIELMSTKGSVVDKLYQFISAPDAVADKKKAENWFNFEDVLFETGSTKLKSSSENQLKNVVEVFKAFPNVRFKLGGYTDNTGSEDVNIKISNDRAEAVYNKLISLGAEQVSFDANKPYEGYGSKHPICTGNDTEECKAQNRRIAIVVTKK